MLKNHLMDIMRILAIRAGKEIMKIYKKNHDFGLLFFVRDSRHEILGVSSMVLDIGCLKLSRREASWKQFGDVLVGCSL